MLTKSRIEKILGLVKKEYDYMDNRPINITMSYFATWSATTTNYDYTLSIGKNFEDYNFTEFFYPYIAKEFNFDLTWALVDIQNTMNALVLLHEIGHIQQTMNMELTREWSEEINRTYNIFKIKAREMDEGDRLVAYRKIKYEYLADKFAVEMFNKYAVKILAILNGVSQKEIKNRLEVVKKGLEEAKRKEAV